MGMLNDFFEKRKYWGNKELPWSKYSETAHRKGLMVHHMNKTKFSMLAGTCQGQLRICVRIAWMFPNMNNPWIHFLRKMRVYSGGGSLLLELVSFSKSLMCVVRG